MWLNLFQKRREKSLDDDAQRIREASESAAETIKTRLSSLPADETLFVLVGENHAMPAHMIFQMCLFDILRKAKLVFGVALEHPSNWVVTCSLNLLSEDPQTKVFMQRLSWKWRKRSSVKIAERTYEKRAQALHC